MAKSRYKYLLAASAVAIVLMLWSTLPQLLPERVSTRYDQLVNYGEDESAESRLWNWEFCKRVGVARPLVGGGFDFYSVETLSRYYPEFLDRWPGKVWSCHSIWLTILGEHGIPAMILWVSLIASCFLSLRKVSGYEKSGVMSPVLLGSAGAVQVALVAYLVVGTFLDAAYFDMFYYLVAVVIIMKERMIVMPADEVATAEERGLAGLRV
jgi:O-antigen ligase